ncbi:hypothetical protein C4J81_13130 [Deltaproteobacteria bacterium Smac51]|nr:hypothetical protein C4J81_13130 [Deltaproteobacteria bacterium Smac51]
MTIEMSDQYASYLHDESRLTGEARSISFPETEPEAIEIVRSCYERQVPITVQGSRTGLCGGAVPCGGHILNLSRMAAPLSLEKEGDTFLLTVQPGLMLSALGNSLRARRFEWAFDCVDSGLEKEFKSGPEMFWPPDPSELTASIGGIVSTNGRGPGAFKYGSACAHVHSVRLITADGNIAEAVNQPDNPLFSAVIGGEGMFGAITAVTLRLSPKPPEMWGICFFFNDENSAAAFIDKAKSLNPTSLAALDFLDGASMKMVDELKKVAAKLRELPDTPENAAGAVYMEIHADDEAQLEETAGQLMEAAEELGSDMDSSWSLAGDEMEKLRLFRHAVPEALNAALDRIRQKNPEIHKTAGDFTWPESSFGQTVQIFRQDISQSGLDGFIFGHSTDNHLHVNLLPGSQGEKEKALSLMEKWLKISREQGGSLFREHGVGKLKKKLYAAAQPPEEIAAVVRLKETFDPSWLWNPGNKIDRGE